MFVFDFTERSRWSSSLNADIQDSLMPVEKELCKRLQLLRIVEKRGRVVPVLRTPDVKVAIDALLANRSKVCINAENPFLFARVNSSSSCLRGWDSLKLTVTEVELKRPELITSTRLRKYAVPVYQILDLIKSELNRLAKHLGHEISVHREFYQLQHSTLELAKVGRMLIAVDEGKTNILATYRQNGGDSLELDDSEKSNFDLDEVMSDDRQNAHSEKATSTDTNTTRKRKMLDNDGVSLSKKATTQQKVFESKKPKLYEESRTYMESESEDDTEQCKAQKTRYNKQGMQTSRLVKKVVLKQKGFETSKSELDSRIDMQSESEGTSEQCNDKQNRSSKTSSINNKMFKKRGQHCLTKTDQRKKART